MKKIALLLGCLTVLQIFGNGIEKTIKSKPEKIIVYTQGAQVQRNCNVNLLPGQNKIIFTGLENCIIPNAIQASGNGNFIITDIQHSINYPELDKVKTQGDIKYKKVIKTINDSLHEVEFLIDELNIKMEALSTEKNVLLNYGLYKGLSKKDSIQFLKDGLSFLREKLYNINFEQLKIKRDKEKLTNLLKQLNDRMQMIVSEINNSEGVDELGKVDYRIIVNVIADQATQANVNLSYYITSAGWQLAYDLRAISNEPNIKLTYKALIQQQTGIDWDNVKLILSTANPNQSYTIPNLNIWYLGYQTPNKEKWHYPNLSNGPKDYAMPESKVSGIASESEMLKPAFDASYFTTVNNNFIETEYEIKLNYNIPSDNKQHYAIIMVKDLKTMLRYKAVPKINNHVYLTALLPNWEDEITMSGQASIYYDGTFIGQTNLTAGGTEDTLQVSLGIDKNLTIKRSKVKDKCIQKFLDNDIIHNYAFEILVKNNRNSKVEVEILDQLPLSQNKQIIVEHKELSGAYYNEITGIVNWRINLQAKDNKKLIFYYQIKSPKNVSLALQ